MLLSLLLLWTSCGNRQRFDGEVLSTSDNSLILSELSSTRNLVDVEGSREPAIYGKTTGFGVFCTGSGTTVTNLGPQENELLIDFGSGCNCADGRLRTGKIRARFTGFWKDPGSTVVITPENYTVAGWAVLYTATFTHAPLNAQNQSVYNLSISNATLSSSLGTIRYNASLTYTWAEGEGTASYTDNVFLISGSITGTSRSWRTFSTQITTPLRYQLNCAHVTSGVLEITPDQLDTREIDFGPGSCDDQATLTVGEYQQPATLP